ncbi:hypothetical protein [Ktedonobacter sp. SOSP1-85]|uniref:hypothetical protein n=1 Tax=Ktedonobacter sp. SOSP1-85 TaxID=2778367 RepID=UPI0019159DDB|nr:hypothetical protein [Ktedonobacter sp. SOSP1-85]
MRQRQEANTASKQEAIAQARAVWLGHWVVFENATLARFFPGSTIPGSNTLYGGVLQVTDDGQVQIVYAYKDNGEPICLWTDVFSLGVRYHLMQL